LPARKRPTTVGGSRAGPHPPGPHRCMRATGGPAGPRHPAPITGYVEAPGHEPCESRKALRSTPAPASRVASRSRNIPGPRRRTGESLRARRRRLADRRRADQPVCSAPDQQQRSSSRASRRRVKSRADRSPRLSQPKLAGAGAKSPSSSHQKRSSS
jgi:hypothetical protein